MSADFDAMLGALRALARLPEDAAKAAAPLVEDALRASVAAERAPDGTPWTPRRKGSGPMYAHAPDRIKVVAIKTLIRATLTGPEVYAHFGTKNTPRRPMLPDPGTLPANLARILEDASAKAFAKAVAA